MNIFDMKGINFIKTNNYRWLLMVVMMLCTVNVWGAKNARFVISVNGKARDYTVYVPDNNVSGKNYPVIFTLSKGEGSTWDYPLFEGLTYNKINISDEYIVVRPAPYNGHWHTSGDMSDADFFADVNFFKMIAQKISKVNVNGTVFNTDKDKYYLVGTHQGAKMVYSCASATSDIFAGYAAITGYPETDYPMRTTSSRPVPFMQVMGIDNSGWYQNRDMLTLVDNMTTRNGCHYMPDITRESNYTRYEYKPIDIEGSTGDINSYTFLYYVTDYNTPDLYQSAEVKYRIWEELKKYSLPRDYDYSNSIIWHPCLSELDVERTDYVLQKSSSIYSDYYLLEKGKTYKLSFNTNTDQQYNGALILNLLDDKENKKDSKSVNITTSVEQTFSVSSNGLYRFEFRTNWPNMTRIQASNVRVTCNGSTIESASGPHGVIRNRGNVIFKYGENPTLNNVYRCVQFKAGSYDLNIKANKSGRIHILMTNGNGPLFDDDLDVSTSVSTFPFTMSKFEEFQLTITSEDESIVIEDIYVTGKVSRADEEMFNNNEVELVRYTCCYPNNNTSLPSTNYDTGYTTYQAGKNGNKEGNVAIHFHLDDIADYNQAVLNIDRVERSNTWEVIFESYKDGIKNNAGTKRSDIASTTKSVVYDIPANSTEIAVTVKFKDGQDQDWNSSITVKNIQLLKTVDISALPSIMFSLPFDKFIGGTNTTWSEGSKTLSVSHNSTPSGWDFGLGRDFSGYDYLVFTSVQNRAGVSNSAKIVITDGTNTVKGKFSSDSYTDDSKAYTISGKSLCMDSNNPNITILNLKKLRENNKINTRKIKKISFEFPANSNDVLMFDNVFATTILPVEQNQFKLTSKTPGNYGTICFPYDVACSGARIYEVKGLSADKTTLSIERIEGIVQAGKAYLYRTEKGIGVPESQTQDVHFYKVTQREIDNPIKSNGLVGTFVRISPLEYGKYILKDNQVYYVNSNVNIGQYRAYLDLDEKFAAQTASAKMRIFVIGEDDEFENTEITSISNMESNDSVEIIAIYSINGNKVSQLHKGINLVKLRNGSIKKIIKL